MSVSSWPIYEGLRRDFGLSPSISTSTSVSNTSLLVCTPAHQSSRGIDQVFFIDFPTHISSELL